MKRGVAIISILAAGLITATSGQAQTPLTAPFDKASANAWTSNYYLTRDPTRIPAYLDFIAANLQNDQVFVVSGFLSVVFEDNRDQVQLWLAGRSFQGAGKAAVGLALAYAGRVDLLQAIDPALADKVRAEPLRLDRARVASTLALEDTLWGAFLASGRVDYVRPIIAELGNNRPSKAPLMDIAAKAAATWSLGVNMHNHDRVYRLVRDEDKRTHGSVKLALDELLQGYEQKRIRLPQQNGELSAMIAVIPQADMAEFETPSDHPVRVHRLETAKLDETVAVKIAFDGMGLSEANEADVTYDLRVIDPNGKTAFEHKDMEGLKGRLASSINRIFDNRAVVTAQLDTMGVYQIDAVLHDNIADTDMPLHAQIEVK